MLPTVSGRINDITRLTPQYGGSGTFAGQDNRMNNITVDGSYFNNSFGLGGQPGDRTGVAPISLEAIEQVQVSVAPFDVRQGNFVGAGVNTVTRSGTNRLSASIYHRFRNESFVGTEAKGLAFNPGVFSTDTTGGWAGGPIVKNRLFAFGSYEKQEDTRPLSTFRANAGGETAAGSVTRVLASDLNAISALAVGEFRLRDRPVREHRQADAGQAVPRQGRLQPEQQQQDQLPLQPAGFEHRRAAVDLVVARLRPQLRARTRHSSASRTRTTTILENYQVRHRRVELDHRHQHVEQPHGRLHDQRREPRRHRHALPVHRHPRRRRRGVHLLRQRALHAEQRAALQHVPAAGQLHEVQQPPLADIRRSLEKYNSENVFFPGKQSAYVYNSLADFYTDLNGYLANPNRTTSPVTLRRFQVRYTQHPRAGEADSAAGGAGTPAATPRTCGGRSRM